MRDIRKLMLCLMVIAMACGTAFAGSITFLTPAGASEASGGQAVAAEALVTMGAGFVTVQLWNLLGTGSNPSISNAGQLLSDFDFTLGSTAGSVSYAAGTSGSANLVEIARDGGATADGATAQLGWGLTARGAMSFDLRSSTRDPLWARVSHVSAKDLRRCTTGC